MMRSGLLLVGLLILIACKDGNRPAQVVGELASDRVELVAHVREPITDIVVGEGQQVAAGDILARQDIRDAAARVAEMAAAVALAEAQLAEAQRGPRAEMIIATRARLKGAEDDVAFRRTELTRADALVERQLGSDEQRDNAKAALDSALATQAALKAELDELENGTTAEQLDIASERVAQAIARLEQSRIAQDRLTVRAPSSGIIDSVLFEVGETPAVGDVLIVLLGAAQAHARVYVPEAQRVNLSPGSRAQVFVDGLAQPLDGRLRRIANEATFTPYFALTEYDRGRLSYVAEVDIIGADRRLPDGVPVQVRFTDEPAQ
ncbi:MAG: HlyD family efflux transporter periplasmic adaptor subunit [Pseudomonadota bacterium]